MMMMMTTHDDDDAAPLLLHLPFGDSNGFHSSLQDKLTKHIFWTAFCELLTLSATFVNSALESTVGAETLPPAARAWRLLMHWFSIKLMLLPKSWIKAVTLFPLCFDSNWYLRHPDPLGQFRYIDGATTCL